MDQKSNSLGIANGIMKREIARNNSELGREGIEPATNEAIPYYLSWSRYELTVAVCLLSIIDGKLGKIKTHLIIIGIGTWIIAITVVYKLLLA